MFPYYAFQIRSIDNEEDRGELLVTLDDGVARGAKQSLSVTARAVH
jgi:hypothetical protein